MKKGKRRAIEIEFESDDDKLCIMNELDETSDSMVINNIINRLESTRSLFDNYTNPVYSDCIQFMQDLEAEGYTDIMVDMESM